MRILTLLFIGFWSSVLLGCTDGEDCVVESEGLEQVACSSSFDTSLEGVYPLSHSISLPVGSEVLINAAGSLTAFNQRYSWNGVFWQGDSELFWSEQESEAMLVAIHPYKGGFLYTSDELYHDGQLIDVLYDVLELPYKSEIELTFKHRFSLLTVTVSPKVEQGLTALELKIPCSVLALSPTTAHLQYDFTQSQSIHLTAQEGGCYQFMIPPVSDLELQLMLEWRGELYTHTLPSNSFESNHQYSYYLKSVEESVGIKTVEDFIAFVKLFNNQTYSGEKSLADFGRNEAGVMTYYLLEDLYFTAEDNAQLSMIGSNANPFNDVFEGNDHIISGLDLSPVSSYAGLFRRVGAAGVVRNLHIRNSQVVRTASTTTYFSLIAAINDGLIDHCSVENCSFSFVSGFGGAIAGYSYGAIVNCWSWGCRFACGISGRGAGGIVDLNYGDLYNCYAGGNTFVNDNSSLFSGISLRASGHAVNVANCYYKAQGQPLRTGAVLNRVIDESSVCISNCYYSSGPLFYGSSLGVSSVDCYLFNAQFRYGEEKSVLDALNEWVDGVGAELPYRFRRWKVGEDGVPACFEE